MYPLDTSDVVTMFLSMGLLLAAARIGGEIARRFHQPDVIGEMCAGMLLGPTVFGRFAPETFAGIFPATGPSAVLLSGLSTFSITMFLLVAGIEVDLSTIFRQGRSGVIIGLSGMILPFVIGFGAALVAPGWLGRLPDAPVLPFALFLGTVLAVSALPVIARTLIDLNLYRSDLGMLIVAVAVFNDLVGWIVFAIILSLIGHGAETNVGETIALILGFSLLVLTAGRALIHRLLPWLQAHLSWPGGVLGFAVSLALLAAAFTEWAGVHAIFGSFLVGVALGDSSHLSEQTRATIDRFVSFIFAPIFFAGIGLTVDFAAHFDLTGVLFLLAVATAGKVGGGMLGARWAGMSRQEGLAVGFGVNARGGMAIILGMLGLSAGLIHERAFVALVVVSFVTSIMSGPALKRILRLKKARHFIGYTDTRLFVKLTAADRHSAIAELSAAAAGTAKLPAGEIAQAVWEREQILATGLEFGVAVPHARLPGLAKPVVAIGLSAAGIEFDAADGKPAHLVFLILTPVNDQGAQLEILADIGRNLHNKIIVEKLTAAGNYTEFRAALKRGSAA